MRAAVDSTILLDVVLDDPEHAAPSQALLEAHLERGSLVVCPVVFAEVAAAFTPCSDFGRVADEMGIVHDDLTRDVAVLAAGMWRDYRRRGGSRRRIVPDFLIGAHALLRADCLLSRDRGYYRDYFRDLRVVAP